MFDSTTTVIMLIIVVFIYLLPTIIAFGRDHRRRMDVAVVNILFGWTLIGWFACFFWAAFGRPAAQPV
jgi:T4 superinfection immunity protein